MRISFNRTSFILLIILGALMGSGWAVCNCDNPDWGFYGHRKINRMAIFTLPPEMMVLYKKEIEYITAHAVDPDKRRYATKHEGVRHYIDVDHWGTFPFDNVPRKFTDALLKFASYVYVNPEGDSTSLDLIYNNEDIELQGENIVFNHSYTSFKRYLEPTVKRDYYEGVFVYDIPDEWGRTGQLILTDEFSEYGILPYFLEQYIARLTNAFKAKDHKRIVQISAEMGHYIGDAHVPLHTTENYNGQMTNQVGIHGFWESRLPELYADDQYDFFVGKAQYIENKNEYFWNIILESHSLLADVLAIEKDLSQTFPSDKQFCYDDRLDRTIRIQCPEYAKAFHDRLKGMVEKRMQDAVLSIGDVWYTAWVEAGQPVLDQMIKEELSEEEKKEQERLEAQFKGGDIKGRTHDN